MKKSIAVIGLGRFGVGLVKSLATKNVDIIAIDKCEENVSKIANVINHALICDSTNENALKQIGIKDVDHAIIAFGQNDPSTIVISIMTVIVLKNLGVKEITVRLDEPYYTDVLLKLGVNHIVSPFDLASERLALKVASNSVMDYYNVSSGYDVFEMIISDQIREMSLLDLNSPKRFKVNIILIKRGAQIFMPSSSDTVLPHDHIFAFGKKKGIMELDNFLHHNCKE